MEVVTDGVQLSGERQGFHGGGVEGVGIAFACLHSSVAEEELLGGDGQTMTQEGLTGDEQIRDACFIFESEEAMPLRGAGTLSADDESRTGNELAMRNGVEVDGSEKRGSGF